MIDIIVWAIMFLFYAYLFLNFLGYTSLILNLVIITVFFLLIRNNLKEEDNHKYYVFSLLITAIFLIFSSSGVIGSFLALTEKLLISIASITVILVYLFAHLIALIYEYSKHAKEKRK